MVSEIIDNSDELEARVYVFPTSALKENDRKINYFNYISSLRNEDCNEALKRIYPIINIEKINEIIENTSQISDIRKEFYKKIIKLRYDKILKYSYNKLINVE